MSSLQNSILRYIDEQFDAIARAPEMWGPPHCVELQVLQLLELRSVTLRPEFESKNPRAILDAYDAFLARKFPDAPPSPLAVLLEQENRSSELMTILGEFCKELIGEMMSEDVFATHDLVLKLQMRSGVLAPPARALSSYYRAFHSVLRAVARKRGTRGRASRAIEYAIDFAMNDVRVIPANGAPAQVVLPLDQPESAERERVKYALDEIVTVNEWAANPDSPVAELRDLLSEEKGGAQHVAAQVLRLMPDEEDAVQTVELGGRFIQRPLPVAIRPSHAMRVLEVIKAEEHAPRDFDRVGTIRAVDIDQRSMRIKIDGKSFKCWMENPELIDVARSSLGQRARVVGHEYRESGHVIIIVHEIRP